MRVDPFWISGFSFGFEFSPDPDFGGTCLVVDLGILRLIIAKEEDDD
jgi:hypothetical protein